MMDAASLPVRRNAAAVASKVRLGMLTPSSNTVLEPITTAMLTDLNDVSVHIARFPVTEISLSERALVQFDIATVLAAARLLADARVHVIAWNGTSAGWLGFASDDSLCRAISAETGIPSTTSVLALNEVMTRTGVRRFGLVTPYLHDIQARIIANYQRHGFECIAERHLNDPGNFSFAEIGADAIRRMVREVAAARPDCISAFCTNMRAAPLVDELERELNIPVYDTVSVVLWKSLWLAGVAPNSVTGWGRLFNLDLSMGGAA
jgi:maleate isomerase